MYLKVFIALLQTRNLNLLMLICRSMDPLSGKAGGGGMGGADQTITCIPVAPRMSKQQPVEMQRDPGTLNKHADVYWCPRLFQRGKMGKPPSCVRAQKLKCAGCLMPLSINSNSCYFLIKLILKSQRAAKEGETRHRPKSISLN